jgi:hypothetical protein
MVWAIRVTLSVNSCMSVAPVPNHNNDRVEEKPTYVSAGIPPDFNEGSSEMRDDEPRNTLSIQLTALQN